jgi:hypothetical protein
MIKNLLSTFLLLLFLVGNFQNLHGQGIPELLYYKFDDTGRTVRNLASSPPRGTTSATIYGNITQGVVSGTCGGKALLGSGNLSYIDYVDTKWQDSLNGTSWTVSFWSRNFDSSTVLYYIFSDPTAGNFRCFMGGVAGAGNIILRGPLADVLITGGAGKLPKVSTFVYDSKAGYIYAYLNGKLVNSVAQSTITINSTGSFVLSALGNSTTTNGINQNGILDEFRFYNRALSASEVSKLLYYGSTSSNVNIKACDVKSFKSPSGKYVWTSAGTYKDTILNKGTCDSFMTINLSFGNNTSSTLNVKTCDFYVGPTAKIYTKSGTYNEVIKNRIGCDSNITINLTILNSSSALLKPKVCDSYRSPSGKYTWTTTGTYYDTLRNKVGCDSALTINLTVYYKALRTIAVKTCDRYRSPSGKRTWTVSGKYTDTIATKNGCDSILTINLTVVKSSSASISITECEKYRSPSKKYLWTSSGTYLDTLLNKSGCDSVITVNLTVNYNSSTLLDIDACERYRSPSGKYLWTISGAYNDTLVNKTGCDSFITVDLKLHPKTSSNQFKSVCVRMLSPSKKYVWTKSGKYNDTIPNRWGCDSVLTFNLTVNEVDVTVTKNEPTLTATVFGATYQWLDCNNKYASIPGATGQVFTAKSIGNYAVKITENSCTDTSACYSISKVGSIQNTAISNGFTAYPNPANGIVNIQSLNPMNNASIKLLSANGIVVSNTNNHFGNSAIINISEQANGIYFLEIIENGNIARIKIVKF